jgi:hypothetical protein
MTFDDKFWLAIFEDELQEQMDMKVSTKFQINPSTNG